MRKNIEDNKKSGFRCQAEFKSTISLTTVAKNNFLLKTIKNPAPVAYRILGVSYWR